MDCLRLFVIIFQIICWIIWDYLSNHLSVIWDYLLDYFLVICRLFQLICRLFVSYLRLFGLFERLFLGYLRFFCGLFVNYLSAHHVITIKGWASFLRLEVNTWGNKRQQLQSNTSSRASSQWEPTQSKESETTAQWQKLEYNSKKYQAEQLFGKWTRKVKDLDHQGDLIHLKYPWTRK